jgi:hypothetical protein
MSTHLVNGVVAVILWTAPLAHAVPPDEVITGPEPANLCIPLDDVTMLACGDGKCDAKDTVRDACPADCKQPEIRPYNSLSLCTKVQAVHAPRSIDEVQQTRTSSGSNRTAVVSARHPSSTDDA